MELLEVLATFSIRARQRDLDELTHLGRPAAEGLDELTKRQRPGWLGLKSVFVDGLHGDRILAAVRRALTHIDLDAEPACDA